MDMTATTRPRPVPADGRPVSKSFLIRAARAYFGRPLDFAELQKIEAAYHLNARASRKADARSAAHAAAL
jgi:uncharacterized protein YqjF (DUF2071 family)